MEFSFIHISDIHIGRAFSSINNYSFDEKVKNIYNNATEKAFNRFIDFSLSAQPDFILISGDTFDNIEQDFKSKLILKEGLKKLEKNGIKVYLICGNHDPVNAYNKNTFDFDENSLIKIIGINSERYSDFTVTDKDNNKIAVIHALSYTENHMSENPLKYFSTIKEDEKDTFHIGLLHCDIENTDNSQYAPCKADELRNFNYNYWALGHIHIPIKKDNNIFYSGTLQGRNPKETGIHGFRFIKVNNNIITENKFIPSDIIRFEDMEINLSDTKDITSSYSDISDKLNNFILNETNSLCELFLIKLKLTGNIEFYDEINDEYYKTITEKIKDIFSSKIYISDINNETNPKIDENILKNDDGISGEIYRTADNENINESFNKAQADFSNIISYCKFTDEEYSQFKTELYEEIKKSLINLANNVYFNENKEDIVYE